MMTGVVAEMFILRLVLNGGPHYMLSLSAPE
jgi:hypothetical protein